MRMKRFFLIVIAALLLLIGVALSAGAGGILWAYGNLRDQSGYFVTTEQTYASSGYALTSSVDFGAHPNPDSWLVDIHLGTVRIRGHLVDDSPIFIGIATTANVDRYLANVSRDDVVSAPGHPFNFDYQHVNGTVSPSLPASHSFWVASSTGIGTQSVTWETQPGSWSAVVMRADARKGVAADVTIGAKSGWVAPLGIGLAILAALFLLVGAILLVKGIGTSDARRRVSDEHPPASAVSTAREALAATGAIGATEMEHPRYPVKLVGTLDPSLSRWRWLVKWFLSIPHLIVLWFLWIAFSVLTFVAGVSILFTGRYPRSIFDFNVGVIRWTWRVAFYAFSALGTDRYPPFRLEYDATYPADFDVEYPSHLSRGLVLVKWWLLAIPQYLIVGIFIGGWSAGPFTDHEGWEFMFSGGLIGLVVCLAAILLAITGHYPRPLFEFVIGLNRWSYRVLAYAALMRDEYPPFRLDTGEEDPGWRATLSPANDV